LQTQIKIFVSRRLDLDSMVVSNPIYEPVICGAVYAKDTISTKNLLEDDTGENISSRRNSFCEFTVQYWAWKNVESDYYGLCHYRRYLTFLSKRFKANSQKQIMEGILDDFTIKKYGFLEEARMRQIIEENDVVVNEAADVHNIPTPRGFQKTVYDHWQAHGGMFFDARLLPLLLETIHRLCSQYDEAADEYLHDRWHRGYNCYVMKKELFFQMCQFQFTVLFDLEKQLAQNGYARNFERTLGYMGEIMYGIFIYYLQKQGIYKIKEEQLVYFEQTVLPDSKMQWLLDKCLFWAKFRFEDIGYKLLPKNSKRRNFIKKIYFSLVKR
jgi:hypothetical protein